jgi:hypothetical protein
MTTPPSQIPSSAAASPYSTPTAGRKNWFSRNWKWFVPTLVMVVFVLPLALCGGAIFAVIRNSDVAKESLLRAQSNPLLVQKLGTPIEEGWLVGGSIDTSTTSGDADLAVPISGPKGKGKIYVTAHKSAGVWSYSVMEAAIEGSDQRINLLSDVTAGAELPPTPPGPAPAPAPAPQPAPSSNALPSTQGEFPGLTLTVQELKRSSSALTLKIVLQSKDGFAFHYDFGEGGNEFGSIGGIHLIDAANKKKYFVVRDADGSCVCSRNIANIAAGSQSVLWAKFPAPPDDVQKITVEIPHFPPFEDVPITR